MQVILDFSWVIIFLNSVFFTGFATILTGVIAYVIFLRQKSEERLKAARVILVEIRDCELLFDGIKKVA